MTTIDSLGQNLTISRQLELQRWQRLECAVCGLPTPETQGGLGEGARIWWPAMLWSGVLTPSSLLHPI